MTLGLGIGIGPSISNSVGYSAAALALFARFTTPPSATRQTAITQLISALQAAGVWSKLDVLYVTAAADAQAAQRNWLANTFNLTVQGSPTFAADRGYTGTASVGDYLATGFTPSTQAAKATQDDGCVFGWKVAAAQDAGPLFGDSGAGSVKLNLFPRYTDDTLYGRFHAGADVSAASLSGSGLWALNRAAAGAITIYRNGASFATPASTSTGLPTTALRLLSDGTTPTSTSQIAAFGYGANLTATQQAALYTAMRTYLTAVGVP